MNQVRLPVYYHLAEQLIGIETFEIIDMHNANDYRRRFDEIKTGAYVAKSPIVGKRKGANLGYKKRIDQSRSIIMSKIYCKFGREKNNEAIGFII